MVRNDKHPGFGWWPYFLLGAGLLLLPLMILGVIYAISLKQDVRILKDTNQKLLATVSQQQKLMRQQTDIVAAQLEVNKAALDVAKQQLDTSKLMLQTAQSSDSKLERSLSIQQQLLGVAQATLQQARDINRKMPPPSPVNNLSL
jgi:hypothetical protein